MQAVAHLAWGFWYDGLVIHSLGVISIVLSWLAVGYLLRKWRGTKAMSMSLHAASDLRAYLFFGVSLTLTGAMLYAFMLVWFIPRYSLGVVFTGLICAAILGQMIAAWVPDVPGIKRIIHRVAAYGMAATFIPMTLVIVSSGHIPMAARVVGSLALGYMIVSLSLLAFGKLKAHYLILQVLYVLLFQLLLLSAAYL